MISYARGVTSPEQDAGQPQLTPPDPPMVPFAIGGMALWAVAGLALLPFQDRLEAAGNGRWVWICLAGVLWGIPGWITMIRHDAGRRRRRASQP